MMDLQFHKSPSETRVVVAMSGGVDSSATAALLKEAGYDVIGVTLQLYDHGQAAPNRPGTCCGAPDIRDARRVADSLGIPHYVLDMEDVFKRDVIDDFADTYLQGRTPIPCIRCNETVKFRDLLATTRDLGGDLLVTGHYARRVEGTGGPELWRGADHGRDQSYFLFATTRQQLAMLRFPLGDMTKDETRAIAARFGLSVATKADSQDICFVPEGKYADLVERLRPGSLVPGDIVDLQGRVLGRHEGLIRYTVGQRRGLGIGGGEPLYVVRLDAAVNQVVVGHKSALMGGGLEVSGLNWLGDEAALAAGVECLVKLRSAQSPVAARLTALDGGRGQVDLAEPFAGIAPGQACVFYDGERCLGGGWIERAHPLTAAA